MKRILIVDDDLMAAAAVKQPLVRRGYAVTLAGSGDEALERIRCESPDLIVLDVVMPGLSGFDVCRRLRQAEATGRVPVIFLTAKNRVTDMVEGKAAGSDLYLVKPVGFQRLIHMIDMFLSTDLPLQRPGVSSAAARVAREPSPAPVAREGQGRPDRAEAFFYTD